MNVLISTFNQLVETLETLGFSKTCPDCDGSFCKMLWVAKEEGHIALTFPETITQINETHFIENSNRYI